MYEQKLHLEKIIKALIFKNALFKFLYDPSMQN